MGSLNKSRRKDLTYRISIRQSCKNSADCHTQDWSRISISQGCQEIRTDSNPGFCPDTAVWSKSEKDWGEFSFNPFEVTSVLSLQSSVFSSVKSFLFGFPSVFRSLDNRRVQLLICAVHVFQSVRHPFASRTFFFFIRTEIIPVSLLNPLFNAITHLLSYPWITYQEKRYALEKSLAELAIAANQLALKKRTQEVDDDRYVLNSFFPAACYWKVLRSQNLLGLTMKTVSQERFSIECRKKFLLALVALCWALWLVREERATILTDSQGKPGPYWVSGTHFPAFLAPATCTGICFESWLVHGRRLR